MSVALEKYILSSKLRQNHHVELTVIGNSMYPILKNNDRIMVVDCPFYTPGEILVYVYKNQILVHRLLKKSHGIYYCKGDNSFRLDDFSIEDCIGKVVLSNGKKLADYPSELIELSLSVNHAFHINSFDIEKTKHTKVYKEYEHKRQFYFLRNVLPK